MNPGGNRHHTDAWEGDSLLITTTQQLYCRPLRVFCFGLMNIDLFSCVLVFSFSFDQSIFGKV
ncbi:hypothetical protein LguiA_015046 [Lonicera macranthoides]